MVSYKYSRPPFFVPKTVGFALLSVLLLTLLPFVSLGEAAPTGYLAYAVNGFDENLGRFDWNLYITEISGTKDLKSIPLNHKGMYPSWGRNGEVLYFIQRDAGQSDIYAIDPENPKNKKLITPISGTYRFLSVSPNGKKLAFNGYTLNQLPQENQIWVLDIETGQMDVMTQVPHLGWPFSFYGMSWSPNSKQLAFSLARPGWLEHLYILDVETKEIEILTELHKDYYPVWSPDGSRILFLRWNREFDTFYTIDVETRTIEPLFDVDKSTGYWGGWSPEGDYIVYSRWGSIYLYDFATDETEAIVEVDGGIFVLSWSREGAVLAVEPREKLVTTWSNLKRKNY